jgi:DNA (cytosine-5)-methyltransferase 1
MSEVMQGKVDREIGFTLRVGGKSSPIDDRRNWDGYKVDGKVRRLTPTEGLRMQGFPSTFKFPVSDSAAMKQLGNSVAVWAIQDYAKEIIKSLENPRG